MSRRNFLRNSLFAASGLAFATPFTRLAARVTAGEKTRGCGYGPLATTRDETTGLGLLKLPPGFRYRSFGWTGDALADGSPTPNQHDGMACVAHQGRHVTLVRNHEILNPTGSFGAPGYRYDRLAGGGTTTLVFDTVSGQLTSARASLSGTVFNCAGGPTPWGSWLSCEEAVYTPGDSVSVAGVPVTLEREHGFIFEVPAVGASSAKPLSAMGKFVHEAVAVDPHTGIVYETEDYTPAGLYRFLPAQPGKLAAGGKLQMLRIPGVDQMILDVDPERAFPVQWVDIREPGRGSTPGTSDLQGVFHQGNEAGGTSFSRLEGCAWGDGEIFFSSTDGGNAAQGQVFAFNPQQQTLRLVYESTSPGVLDYPDNLTMSPRGGLVVCEDGERVSPRMHGLSTDGQLFPFAANNVVLQGEVNGINGDYRSSEWAGACFSPDGSWLFANIQKPGISLAITGPWRRGLL